MVGRASFGVGPIALNLAASQQSFLHKTKIWCCDSNDEVEELEQSQGMISQTCCSFPIIGPQKLCYSPAMERAIIYESLEYDIVHQHGIWTASSRLTNKWHNQTNGPYVIAPHGSLDPWALKRSTWKKHIALFLYEHKNLERASCLHATSDCEAQGFRSFGLKNSIAVIPNGISESWLLSQGNSFLFRQRHGISRAERILLFLGRITPKKGLPMLLKAMQSLRHELCDWKLLIAGVDEFNHHAEVRSLVKRLSLESYVRFVGAQYGVDKLNAFAAADLFVLPSHSEGSPIAILEALGAGVPVLTTKASSWEELITRRCGWWTDISEKAITKALGKALCQPKEVLREMGRRGKELIAQRYTWHRIARQTISLYEWLLKRGNRPDFVIKD